jgi:hypothetical protein
VSKATDLTKRGGRITMRAKGNGKVPRVLRAFPKRIKTD